MLTWWWDNYSKHNNYPVTFCDFGMSDPARAWCEKRGSLLSFHPKNLSPTSKAPWASRIHNGQWEKRSVWFSKPLVLPQTPYETTAWIDLDCEIKKDLTPLFKQSNCPDGFGICYGFQDHMLEARILKLLKPEVKRVQAGVFVFKKTSPVISAWIANCIRDHEIEHSDETTLSNLLHQGTYDVKFFPNTFNWCEPEIENSDAFIIHHTGDNNKYRLMCDLRL